jgi:hypothetical protein
MPSDAQSSAPTAPRVIGRPFERGRSGNPGGRPRGIEARAREFTEEALQALVAALRNPKERVAAASVLLNYAWGKPRQVIEATAETSITVQHLLAAKAVALDMPMLDAPMAPTEPQVIDMTTIPTE